MNNNKAIIGILAPMDVEAESLVESLQDKEKSARFLHCYSFFFITSRRNKCLSKKKVL